MIPIDAVIFDYGFTFSSEHYFNVPHPRIPQWHDLMQEVIFGDKRVCRAWMNGAIGLSDITHIIQEKTGEDCTSILTYLRDGCRKLRENQAVATLARQLKSHGVPIGLVTVNFDVFNDIIVPSHRYNELFSVIINSCDYAEIDKRVLWPMAFQQLGDHIGYANSLLIEDGKQEPQQFRVSGGYAIEYVNEVNFKQEIEKLSIADQRVYLLETGCGASTRS